MKSAPADTSVRLVHTVNDGSSVFMEATKYTVERNMPYDSLMVGQLKGCKHKHVTSLKTLKGKSDVNVDLNTGTVSPTSGMDWEQGTLPLALVLENEKTGVRMGVCLNCVMETVKKHKLAA